MTDAVLVAHKDRAHDVKKVISKLKSEDVTQAETFPKDHRPWGWFETLTIRGRFQVKRIFMKPGAALSLQSHHHRSEHWIVVEGTARVTVDENIKLVVLNAYWIFRSGRLEKDTNLKKEVDETIRALISSGKNVLLVGDTPTFVIDPSLCKYSRKHS